MRNSEPVLLFDGHCNLCSGLVQFILRNDSRGSIKMASLQSAAGKRFLDSAGLGGKQTDSMVFIRNGEYWLESDAVLRLANELGGWWKISGLLRFIPRLLRDLVYRFIARNRYRIWGKSRLCYVPLPEWESRFVENENT